MPPFFAPTVWLSSRLSFSRKYLLIGILVLIALAALSAPLLQRAHEDSQLASIEREGLKVFIAQADALVAMVELRSQKLADPSVSPSSLLRAKIHQAMNDARLKGLHGQAARLELSWRQASATELEGEKQQRFATQTGAINALLGLIQASARTHHLSVDAEIDAVSDMLTRRLPLVIETLSKQQDALALGVEEMSSYAVGAQVVLTDSVPDLKSGVAQLLDRVPAISSLKSKLTDLLDGIARQQDTADRALGDISATEELRTLTRENLTLARGLLDHAVDAADSYLSTRIERLQRARWIIAGQVVITIAVIAYLFAGIYLSTLHSLKTLSEGTAAFCNGRLDARITIDTRDELVLVARNFNQVATEFGNLLEIIREQNESRQRELEKLVRARTAELADKNEQLRAASERVLEELELARNMQAAILPQNFPNESSWSMHASMFPARELGGDFYDYFPLGDERYGVLIADVSGKGVGAAFFMAVSRTVLLDLAVTGDSPSRILARANELLCERNPMDLFVTLFYGIYNARDGRFIYSNAGHCPPVRRQASGDIEVLPCLYDIALAVMPEYEYSDCESILEPGDALVLFTDGVTEAFAKNGEAYGDARLQTWLSGTAPECDAATLVNGLVRNVAQFVNGADRSDDLTCLVLTRKPGAQLVNAPPVELRNKTLLLDHKLPSRIEEIAELAKVVESALPDRPDLAFTANLCLEELIVNTIQHGLKGVPSRLIHVRMSLSNEWLEIMLRDDAPPFDPFTEAPPPDLELDVDEKPIGGLGIHIVKTMMDDARTYYDGSGNLIILLKTLSK